MIIKKVLKSQDKKLLIVPKHSNIQIGDYCKIIKIRNDNENDNEELIKSGCHSNGKSRNS